MRMLATAFRSEGGALRAEVRPAALWLQPGVPSAAAPRAALRRNASPIFGVANPAGAGQAGQAGRASGPTVYSSTNFSSPLAEQGWPGWQGPAQFAFIRWTGLVWTNPPHSHGPTAPPPTAVCWSSQLVATRRQPWGWAADRMAVPLCHCVVRLG